MLKVLRNIPFLRRLSTKELKEIYKISKIREYGPGEAIFGKSSPADRMFIVLSGRVKIFTYSGGKKRKTFAYLEEGDFFGEMALLEGKPRSAAAQAVSYSRLLVVASSDFNRLLVKRPELSLYLLRTVSERLRRANAEIESLLFQNILGRVAKTLCELARRGTAKNGGVYLSEGYTQQELADLVGTTREPLTRAVSTLRRANLVDFRDNRYLIPDLEKLRALCLLQ
jgi:CRP-like cAMP-binding protein